MLVKVTEIISNTWQYYSENFKKIAPYMLMLLAPNFIIGISGIILIYLDQFANSGIYVLINNLMALSILAVCLLLTLWISLALAKNLAAIVTKKDFINYKESFSITSHLIWPTVYTSLLVALVVIGGTLLFIIPGIIFYIWYSFTYYAVIFEEKKGLDALASSKEIVSGRWWSILWRLLVPNLFFAVIFAVLISATTTIIFRLVGGYTLGYYLITGMTNSIISVIFAPLTTLTVIILYFNAKDNPVAKKLNEIQ